MFGMNSCHKVISPENKIKIWIGFSNQIFWKLQYDNGTTTNWGNMHKIVVWMEKPKEPNVVAIPILLLQVTLHKGVLVFAAAQDVECLNPVMLLCDFCCQQNSTLFEMVIYSVFILICQSVSEATNEWRNQRRTEATNEKRIKQTNVIISGVSRGVYEFF